MRNLQCLPWVQGLLGLIKMMIWKERLCARGGDDKTRLKCVWGLTVMRDGCLLPLRPEWMKH